MLRTQIVCACLATLHVFGIGRAMDRATDITASMLYDMIAFSLLRIQINCACFMCYGMDYATGMPWGSWGGALCATVPLRDRAGTPPKALPIAAPRGGAAALRHATPRIT